MCVVPRHVVLPPQTVVGDEPYMKLCWQHLYNCSAASSIETAIDPALSSVCWSAFEFIVDDVVCVYDYSDFLLVDAACGRYAHWLRFHHTRSFYPSPNLGSFPPMSFLDWEQYHRLSQSLNYNASGDAILHKQFFVPSMSRTGQDLYRRRGEVQAKLVGRFGALVDTAIEPQEEFWRTAAECLVSVHVPGSFQHSLDRGQHQLMGLGVCTISPEIWTATLDERPQRDLHYIACQDDYSDLLDRIEWCRSHRAECIALGQRAKAFFRSHSTPQSIWTYISRRISQPLGIPPSDEP